LTRTPTAEELIARGNIPRHVAIIMDGNGRWAKARGVPRIMGHRAGRESVREAVKGCSSLGVQVLTLYTFSIENWQRPAREVSALMTILRQTLRAERAEQRTRLRSSGASDRARGRPRRSPPPRPRTVHGHAAEPGAVHSGRAGILDAVRGCRARELNLDPARVDDELLSSYLYTGGLPDPDLLIRTSGEMRISNFMLWQVAYTELWITETLWPDFRRRHLFEAVADFQARERRFGRSD
jgi:undecaprenyl diphosphate synthase